MDEPTLSNAPKLLIILRGPPGTGKTSVADEIRRTAIVSHRTAAVVNLDHGWCADQRPAKQSGQEKYPELVSRTEDVLVVELAQGEPSLLGVPGGGATHNPLEWLGLVADRKVSCFLLWAEWEELRARVEKRGETEASVDFLKSCFNLHQTDPLFHNFAERAGVSEQRISISGKTAAEILNAILSACPI